MKLTRIKTNHPQYAFVEKLFLDSFPENERRPLEEQRSNTDGNDAFSCYLLTEEDGLSVGFITIWDLDSFYYAEHFAVDPSLRNGGYGSRVMQALLKEMDKPLVLEVELPDNEMSCRRIGFYERQGFRVWSKDYMQPSYRAGGDMLPLYLMMAGGEDVEPDVQMVKKAIYEKVYGVK